MSDFKTVLVRDSVIGDITSDIDFAVKSGASQTTYQRFPSTSASNSSVIFNVQVPSENVVIGRDLLLTTGLTVSISITGVPVGSTAFAYGQTDSFQAFPFASLLTTASAQINNTTVSINLKDVLPSLLRMNNSRELYRFNSMTPALPDQAYGIFSQGVGANNNPLAGYNNASYDIDQVPRGSQPVNITVLHNVTAGGTNTSLVSTDVLDTWTVVVSTVVTEPLFLSPFIFGDPHFNTQGLLGINNMSLTLNVDSTCKRVWSTSNPWITNITLGSTLAGGNTNGFQVAGGAIGQFLAVPSAPALLFKFLSTQPSDLIQTKNVVPYMDFPRYLTSASNAVAVPANQNRTLTSSNLQINQIPDMFIISVRKPMSEQDWNDPSAFFVINSVSINLNNQSGLLSSSSQYDLWRASIKNGSTQSWQEFSGQGAIPITAGANIGKTTLVATTGSLLVLNPAFDLSLPDYISCGSLGNYNFQFTVNVTNQFGVEITPEICVICVNSGVMTTQQGVSAVYTGILTKEMVLDAKSKQQAGAFHSQEIRRMTGGRLLDMPLTAMKALKRFRGMMPHSLASAVGGIHSGGRSSGGKSRLDSMC